MSTSTAVVPHVSNRNALRGKQGEPFKHYRPILLRDSDLVNVSVIQRAMLKDQSKPKSGVNFAQAVRAAVAWYAKHLEKK